MKKLLPNGNEIVAVSAVISFLLYGWTFILFFWKLPSWLHFLNAGEIFSAFSYGVIINVMESLFVLGILLGLAAILPSRFLRGSFALRGTLITVVSLVSIMLYQYQYRAARQDFTNAMPYWSIATISVFLVLIFLAEKVKVIKSVILNLADRLTVFLYLLLPLSLISIIVVILRNI